MSQLTDRNIDILEYLSEYKYLTITQLVNLGISDYKESVRRMIKRFADTNYLVKKSFAIHPTRGRLEDIYSLSKEGAYFLSEIKQVDIDTMRYVTDKRVFTRDYFHRIMCVDIHIELMQFLAYNSLDLMQIDFYYDMQGANNSNNRQERLRSKTKMLLSDGTMFIPDIVIKYKNQLREFLDIYEIHYGEDSKRALEQIEVHAMAIAEGVVANKYNYNKDNRVIYIFNHQSTKEAVERRFLEINRFEPLRSHFKFFYKSILE